MQIQLRFTQIPLLIIHVSVSMHFISKGLHKQQQFMIKLSCSTCANINCFWFSSFRCWVKRAEGVHKIGAKRVYVDLVSFSVSTLFINLMCVLGQKKSLFFYIPKHLHICIDHFQMVTKGCSMLMNSFYTESATCEQI